MRKFNVTVNGTTYVVEIEELGEGTATVAAPAAAPAAAPKAAAPKAAAPAGANAVKAPFPGTVVKVNVTAGQAVKKGDVLAVIEAMKMENEISAPADGTVAAISVSKGASVQAGDVLVSLN